MPARSTIEEEENPEFQNTKLTQNQSNQAEVPKPKQTKQKKEIEMGMGEECEEG